MIDPKPAVPPSELVSSHRVSACGDVLYVPNFFDDASAMQQQLTSCIAWREESLLIFGRRVKVPRLCAWYGDCGVAYRYSHTAHEAEPWPPLMRELRDTLHCRLGIRFNFALANLYRDGNDAMGWHSDDERVLGEFPCIASLSFGATRRFCLRDRTPQRRRVSILLEAGSLLLMWGASQRDWQHALPRSRAAIGRRLNLTFRTVERAS